MQAPHRRARRRPPLLSPRKPPAPESERPASGLLPVDAHSGLCLCGASALCDEHWLRAYAPLPTAMIGQLSLVVVARSVSPPFFSSLLICVSLVIKTGFALAFQVRIVSFQIGEYVASPG